MLIVSVRIKSVIKKKKHPIDNVCNRLPNGVCSNIKKSTKNIFLFTMKENPLKNGNGIYEDQHEENPEVKNKSSFIHTLYGKSLNYCNEC